MKCKAPYPRNTIVVCTDLEISACMCIYVCVCVVCVCVCVCVKEKACGDRNHPSILLPPTHSFLLPQTIPSIPSNGTLIGPYFPIPTLYPPPSLPTPRTFNPDISPSKPPTTPSLQYRPSMGFLSLHVFPFGWTLSVCLCLSVCLSLSVSPCYESKRDSWEVTNLIVDLSLSLSLSLSLLHTHITHSFIHSYSPSFKFILVPPFH